MTITLRLGLWVEASAASLLPRGTIVSPESSSAAFQPHSRAAAILRNELDAGGFEGGDHLPDCVIRHFHAVIRLKPLHGRQRQAGGFGQLSLRPANKTASRWRAFLLLLQRYGPPGFQ